MRSLLKGLLLVSVVFTGCQSDLYTKQAVTERLGNQNQQITLIQGCLDLRYTENETGAFGLLHQVRRDLRKHLLVGLQLTTLLVVGLVVLINRRQAFARLLPFALVLAGGLGNLIDRIRFGHVVDFIHFQVKGLLYWPAFNLADVLIFAGVVLLILQLLLDRGATGRSRA